MDHIKEFKKLQACVFGPPSRAGVYGVFIMNWNTKKEKVVYIGSSKNLNDRIHKPTHHYMRLHRELLFPLFVYTKIMLTDDYKEVEKALIKHFKPKFNIIGKQ